MRKQPVPAEMILLEVLSLLCFSLGTISKRGWFKFLCGKEADDAFIDMTAHDVFWSYIIVKYYASG